MKKTITFLITLKFEDKHLELINQAIDQAIKSLSVDVPIEVIEVEAQDHDE